MEVIRVIVGGIRILAFWGFVWSMGCSQAVRERAPQQSQVQHVVSEVPSFTTTHLVRGECSLYATGPQQGSAPDAVLASGTPVMVDSASDDSDFVWVVTNEGMRGQVSKECLHRASH